MLVSHVNPIHVLIAHVHYCWLPLRVRAGLTSWYVHHACRVLHGQHDDWLLFLGCTSCYGKQTAIMKGQDLVCT